MKQKILALLALVLSTSGGSCSALPFIDAEIFRLEVIETNRARSVASAVAVEELVQELA